MRLENETVVITGAAGGFGSRLCRSYGELGARVEALDVDARGLSRLKRGLSGTHRIKTAVLDVSNDRSMETYARKLAREKAFPIIWINNAGTAFPQPFEDATAKRFREIFEVNLNGVLNGTRAALKLMQRAGRGTIVNVASVTGYLPCPFMTSYAASKSAVIGFTKSLQAELSHRGSPVKLVLVSPGFADTAILRKNGDFPLPKLVSWMMASPETVARDIVDAVANGKEEVFPGWNALVFLALEKFMPKAAFRAFTRILASRNFPEMIGFKNVRSG